MTDEDFQDLKKRVEILESILANGQAVGEYTPSTGSKINFQLNERAFASKYGSSKTMSKRFCVLVAFHSKGDASVEVAIKDIQDSWNRMKSLLGNFNWKYSTDAKTDGWVNSPKKGFYSLAPGWEEVFDGGEKSDK